MGSRLATDLTRAAVALSKARVADLQAGYRLTGEPAAPQPVSSPPWWTVPALAALTVLSAVMALITARWRSRRRPDRPAAGRAAAERSGVLDVENSRPIG